MHTALPTGHQMRPIFFVFLTYILSYAISHRPGLVSKKDCNFCAFFNLLVSSCLYAPATISCLAKQCWGELIRWTVEWLIVIRTTIVSILTIVMDYTMFLFVPNLSSVCDRRWLGETVPLCGKKTIHENHISGHRIYNVEVVNSRIGAFFFPYTWLDFYLAYSVDDYFNIVTVVTTWLPYADWENEW